jgi:hypothetical protein
MHGGDVISHVNITSVRVEDGGTYQCVASNRVGEISHGARLNVYGRFQITKTQKLNLSYLEISQNTVTNNTLLKSREKSKY